MTKYELQKTLEKALGHSIYISQFDPDSRRVVIEFKNKFAETPTSANEITFEKMATIAEILKTRNINFSGETEEHALSELTIDTEYSGELSCADVGIFES